MIRRLLLPLFLLGVAWGELFFPAAVTGETIRLRPGFQHIIEFPEARRVSIGNPAIIEARPLPRKDGVLVVGKKEGETDLVIWGQGGKKEWTVSVAEGAGAEVQEASGLAALFPELSIHRTGSSIIISGTVATGRDKDLLENFARAREKVHLRISLPEDRKTLLSYDLKIIEISRGATAQLGIRWPDSLSAKGAWSQATAENASFRVATDFEARLNLLMANGRAKILANPKLVCESGGSADFLAGGEIPVVIVTPETRTVEWKTYGIILKLRPQMDQGNRIRTHITAEISTVDHGSGGSDVPGLLTRRVTTNFSTPPGGTVMLSGLIKSEMAKDVAKVPLLGQIPILGELFKSRNFRENNSELAIFITPTEVKEFLPDEIAAWQTKSAREQDEMRFRLID
ncbi:MAG: type II and III secretion system protein family protein [Candidatus Deferrimicrobiaceae bacterium]